VAGFHREVVAVLGRPPREAPERLVRDLVRDVRGDLREAGFSTGVSRAVTGPAGIPAGYEQARTAVRVGRRVDGEGAVAHFDRLGVHRLLSLIPDGTELRTFAEETRGELTEDDDLRRTLEVLLEQNCNVAEAARTLHFHYNTLRYRIAKLERLVGPFTTDAHLRLDLQVALQVLRMRGT
jgi:purine catabolism regulator